MNEPLPQPETINRLFEKVYPSFALLAGMELDLFTPLKNGPLTAEQLAGMLGVRAGKLRPLLYVLAAAGLLLIEGDRFANSPEADHYLVRGRPGYMGGVQELTASNWRRVLTTAGTIRHGGPLEMYDYHDPSPEELAALFRGLYPGAVKDAHSLLDHYDFSTCQSLLDAGGGSGGLAITLAAALPGLQATVIDLPMVTPVTRQFVDEANANSQVKILSGDVVGAVPPGSYEVVVARHFIQVLSEKDAQALLQNLAAALKPGGRMHLVGWVLDDSRLGPPPIVSYNLVLLNNYPDGQAYTESEHRRWLHSAGLMAFERILLPDGESILTAHKPG